MNPVSYPTSEEIIEFNALVLSIIKIKKSDQHKVLSLSKIRNSIELTKKEEGDTYDKATVLLKSLIRNYAFASGNRRTAFITTKEFIQSNKGKFKIPDHSSNSKVMLGIRENFYSDEEIKEWIKNGKIREFSR